MAISYVGSYQNSSTGSFTLAWPTGHATDDVGLLVIEHANETATTPSGWTYIGGSGVGTAGGTAATSCRVYWARATSSSMASVSIADAGNHTLAAMFVFRGCVNTGDPSDAAAVFRGGGWGVKSTASTSTTWGGSSEVSSYDNVFPVWFASNPIDNATAQWNSATHSVNGNVGSLLATAATSSGNGGQIIGVWPGTLGPAGSSSGTLTCGIASSVVDSYGLVFLVETRSAAKSAGETSFGSDVATVSASVAPVDSGGAATESAIKAVGGELVSDNFNRANGDLIYPWLQRTAAVAPEHELSVNSNALRSTLVDVTGGDFIDRYIYDVPLPQKQFAEAKITSCGDQTYQALVLRASRDSTTDGVYFLVAGGTLGDIVVVYVIKDTQDLGGDGIIGIYTDLSYPPGTILRGEVDGDTASVYLGGTLIGSVTDPGGLPRGNYAGVSIADYTPSSYPAITDNWSAGDLIQSESKPTSDAVTGADASTVSVQAADGSTTFDSASVTATASAQDVATATDPKPSVAVQATEAAAGSESARVIVAATPDASMTFDSPAVLSNPAVSDVAGAMDSASSSSVTSAGDTGSVSEPTPTVIVTASDMGQATDSAFLAYRNLYVSDVAGSTDTATVTVAGADTSASSESAGSSTAAQTMDTATGSDPASTVTVRPVDAGSVVDQATLSYKDLLVTDSVATVEASQLTAFAVDGVAASESAGVTSGPVSSDTAGFSESATVIVRATELSSSTDSSPATNVAEDSQDQATATDSLVRLSVQSVDMAAAVESLQIAARVTDPASLQDSAYLSVWQTLSDTAQGTDSASVVIRVDDASVSVEGSSVLVEGVGVLAPRAVRVRSESRVDRMERDPFRYSVQVEGRLRIFGREDRTLKAEYTYHDPRRSFLVEEEVDQR